MLRCESHFNQKKITASWGKFNTPRMWKLQVSFEASTEEITAVENFTLECVSVRFNSKFQQKKSHPPKISHSKRESIMFNSNIQQKKWQFTTVRFHTSGVKESSSIQRFKTIISQQQWEISTPIRSLNVCTVSGTYK